MKHPLVANIKKSQTLLRHFVLNPKQIPTILLIAARMTEVCHTIVFESVEAAQVSW